MTQYRAYFINAANKAEESFLIDTSTPQAALNEALLRCVNPTFVAVEVWDGTACALTKRLNRMWSTQETRPPPMHLGDV